MDQYDLLMTTSPGGGCTPVQDEQENANQQHYPGDLDMGPASPEDHYPMSPDEEHRYQGSDIASPDNTQGVASPPQSPMSDSLGPRSPDDNLSAPASPDDYSSQQSPGLSGSPTGPASPTGSGRSRSVSPAGSGRSRSGSYMSGRSRSGSPMGSGRSRSASPMGSGRSRSGSSMGSGRSRSGSPMGSGRSRSGSPVGSGRSRSGSPMGSGRSHSGSQMGSGRSRSGSPMGSGRSRSGSPMGSGRSRSGSPMGSGRSRSGSPMGSGRSRSVSPAGSGRSHSVSPAGSGRSRSVSPAGSGRSRSVSLAGSGRSRSVSPAGSGRSRSVSPAGSGRSRSASSAGSGRRGSVSPARSGRSRSVSPAGSGRRGSVSPARSGRSRSVSPAGSGRSRSASPVGGLSSPSGRTKGGDGGQDSDGGSEVTGARPHPVVDDDDSDKESAVGELIADIFGSSDEDEEFEGFGEADVQAKPQKREKKPAVGSDGENEGEKATTEAASHDLSSDDEMDGLKRKERSEDFVSDFELMLARKKEEMSKRRRKRKDVEIINDNDDLIVSLIKKMKEMAEEDRELNQKRLPAVKKLKMLSTLMPQLKKTDLHIAFLDLGILGAMTEWLAPLPDRSLPHLKIREAFLNQLVEFPPINSELLKNSGVGKAVMYLYKHPKEVRINKELAGKLINDWSRPIFNLTSNYKSLSREEREQRDYEQLPKKRRLNLEGGMTPHRDLEKDLSGKDTEAKPGMPGFVGRARVPQPSKKDYVIRPKWNVDEEPKRAASKKPLSKLEKHQRAFAERKRSSKQQRAVAISIEGRNMAL